MDFADSKLIQRFWSKVQRSEPDKCWEWSGWRHDRGGYGLLRQDGKKVRASRIAAFLSCGTPRAGQIAIHHCDNPPCCNPSHLIWGSHSENRSDAFAKRRVPHTHKLSPAQVDYIRLLLAAGYGTTAIARWYEVARCAIYKIREGQSWNRSALAKGGAR